MATYTIRGELGVFDNTGKMIAQCTEADGAKLVCAALNKYKPKAPAKAKCRWPAPVYVARYADGHDVRMSFWSDARFPIDLVAAKAQAAKHRPIRTEPYTGYPYGHATGAFVPLVAFHIEHEGRVIGEVESLAA